MKKILLLSMIAILTFSGCNNQQTTNEQNQENTSDQTEQQLIFKYEHNNFSLTLPSEFQDVADSQIKPKESNTFPIINFDVSEQEMQLTQDQLLERAEGKLENLCTQTAGCPKMTSNEKIELDNILGIKFTTYLEGRSVGPEKEGFIKGYQYWFSHDNNLFIFRTSANDLENPEKVEQEFTDIVNTIKFK